MQEKSCKDASKEKRARGMMHYIEMFVWMLFGYIMTCTFLVCLYYIFGIHNTYNLLEEYKSKDWRYDG